ncbi:glycosyltransferase [Inquilinus sp. KBS0705]|nr:glycosyltransferase [Inquilinus sp. KBS0705]
MKPAPVKQPSAKQLLILRSMIVIGLVCMGFFMQSLLEKDVMGYQAIYWLLISTFVYTFFKIIYEWYHYWSIKVPVAPTLTRQYTVDIFTTFCAGEPYEMILETLTAIQAITYPHQSYLCDEANDPYLKEVCAKLGVHHITRIKKINAKAGNINNALSQSTGELCVVLDPDHIPAPNFLDPIVAHFDNPEIGYVQIVQAYYNQDIGWIAKGAAQQTYHFYGPMMMCMNSYGTVQAIGANCTFRRTALESIGGHAAGLAEDMHTAMQLHAKNWKSVYVPEVLAKGLVPATLSAYYKQQLKWSRGVFELLVTSYIKLFTKFTWRQKLHYGLLPLFYLSGFVFLFNFLIPVLALFGDVFPLRMDFSEFLVISLPFITAVITIRHYVQRWVMEDNERGFHLVGGLLLIGTWWVFILGFVYTLIRRDVPYIATPKDVKDEKNLKNNIPNIVVLVISLSAIIYGLYNDWNPFTFFMAGIVSLNCLFMVFMLVASSELKLQVYLEKHPALLRIATYIKSKKRLFWLFRRKMYTGVRAVGAMLLVFMVCVSLYVSTHSDDYSGISSGITNNFFKSFVPASSKKKAFVTRSNSNTLAIHKLLYPAGNNQFLHNDTAIKADSLNGYKQLLSAPKYWAGTRGIIYAKGQYWFKNIYPLTKKIINHDFTEMKLAGINTVKIYGPNVYDSSTFDAAEKQGLKINYSFWIPDASNFVNDADDLETLAQNIVKTVRAHRAEQSIDAWNIGNTSFQQLDSYYSKSQLLYARYNYIKWLKRLVNDIKAADTHRIVTVDVLSSATLGQTVAMLHQQIPQIDAFGVVLNSRSAIKYLADVNAPIFFSNVNPEAFTGSVLPSGSIFYANWQDQQAGTMVSLSGLKDILGRNKPYLHKISQMWNGKVPANNLPQIKILRPALTTTAGASLPYNALIYEYGKWNLAAYINTGLNFEWYLVRTDDYGNAIAINPVGTGASLRVNMPADVHNYKLYLIAAKDNNITTTTSILNIPLKN